nr:MAG TPA: hypothetical protein [Caudoviricetes sp.]
MWHVLAFFVPAPDSHRKSLNTSLYFARDCLILRCQSLKFKL